MQSSISSLFVGTVCVCVCAGQRGVTLCTCFFSPISAQNAKRRANREPSNAQRWNEKRPSWPTWTVPFDAIPQSHDRCPAPTTLAEPCTVVGENTWLAHIDLTLTNLIANPFDEPHHGTPGFNGAGSGWESAAGDDVAAIHAVGENGATDLPVCGGGDDAANGDLSSHWSAGEGGPRWRSSWQAPLPTLPPSWRHGPGAPCSSLLWLLPYLLLI